MRDFASLEEMRALVGQEVALSDWVEMPIGKVVLDSGVNNLKWKTISGKVDLDWLQVDVATGPPVESARREAAGN